MRDQPNNIGEPPPRSRVLHVVRVVWKHGAATILRRVTRRPGASAGPRRVRAFLEELGGSFVKFGQMLALQPDVLPPAYCDELLNLLDRVAPVPIAQVVATLDRELGPAAAAIEAMVSEPLATASIGQVHRAMVAGSAVAVKVQRPGVEQQIQADVRIMRATIWVIEHARLRALYWLIEPTLEFAAWSEDELDYHCEARHMRQLARQAAAQAGARVPAIRDALVTRRVLVAEFLEGISVADYLRLLGSNETSRLQALQARGFEPEAFARNVVANFIRDAFVHGWFHADLHPANLLILPGSAVGYVDFGITGGLSVYARRHLGLLTLAFLQGNLDDMQSAFGQLTVPRSDANAQAFRAGLTGLAVGWYGDGSQRRLRTRITKVMFDLLTLSRQTAMMPDREVTKFIRSAITIDNLIRRFAPGVDIGHELEKALLATVEAHANAQFGVSVWAGATRALDAVIRLRAEGETAMTRVAERSRRGGANVRALQLGAVAMAGALVAVWSPVPAEIGLNFVTGATVIAVSAIVLLVGVAVRA